jgi:hypothetical protein
LLALLVAFQPGCASLEAPKTAHQTGSGKVAIVAAARQPGFKFEGFSRDEASAAALGAGSVFVQCASALGGGNCSGAGCGAVLILWLGICGVAGIVGGVAGAASAPGAHAIKRAETSLPTAEQLSTIQESLRKEVETAALMQGTQLAVVPDDVAREAVRTQDYRPLAALGADTVLEVNLTEAGTQGAGINSPLLGYMQVQVRLVRAHDRSELFSAGYAHHGDRHTLGEWTTREGEPLLRALKSGYEALGVHIYENVFLLYPFPDWGAHTSGFLSASFGLAPVFPLTRGQLTGDRIIGDSFEWTLVDSLQPTLKWQGFPRESDILVAPDDMKRVKNVRYDLVIAREHNLAAGEIVYRRSGLAAPSHSIETPLAPNAHYFWNVRARFDLDGRERVTEWSSTHYAVREQFTAPHRYSYRFRTAH